ncbi:MAG: TolC family protein [Planctomycetia bacterium]|nr:TolC family protein [Planctomycetia bacterium]
MMRPYRTQLAIVVSLAVLCAGCGRQSWSGREAPFNQFNRVATTIEYPNVVEPQVSEALATPPPHKIDSPIFQEYWDITLQEAIQSALWNSQVLRDLGGTVVTNPTGSRTIYEAAIRESDPRYGVEGALSAFDAQLSQSVFWSKNDRALNNVFLGTGTTLFHGDTGTFQTQLSKVAATGTQFAVRNNTNYEANNVPSNTFPSAWDTNVEAEFRHPLLQGGGIEFNRIAGPSATPGLFLTNGVLIARINTDISIADFEASLRNAVSEIENAYWDLYFAYRDLDAKIAARNGALEHWRSIHAKYVANTPGGEAGKEALAREQFFMLQAAVEDAQSGSPGRGSLSGSGSGGGVFRGAGGVFAAERRLRALIGNLTQSQRLLRPIDEPPNAEIVYDWQEILYEALATRVELRRQKWLVRRRELELVAARNFLLPRLDAIGKYRWRGFGNDLLAYGNQPQFADAVGNMFDGNFQEWQLGMQLQAPLGFRQGFSAVRNAELQLSRERAVLRDQERQIAHDLSTAVGDVDRTFTLVRTHYNRRTAAAQQVDAARAAYEADATSTAELSDSRRRLADADAAYYRALCDYAIALKNVHFERGTLLKHNQIAMAEGPWPEKAYGDARSHEADRRRAVELNYTFNRPTIVSQGRPQLPAEAGELVLEPGATVISESVTSGTATPGTAASGMGTSPNGAPVPTEQVPLPTTMPAAPPVPMNLPPGPTFPRSPLP